MRVVFDRIYQTRQSRIWGLGEILILIIIYLNSLFFYLLPAGQSLIVWLGIFYMLFGVDLLIKHRQKRDSWGESGAALPFWGWLNRTIRWCEEVFVVLICLALFLTLLLCCCALHKTGITVGNFINYGEMRKKRVFERIEEIESYISDVSNPYESRRKCEKFLKNAKKDPEIGRYIEEWEEKEFWNRHGPKTDDVNTGK